MMAHAQFSPQELAQVVTTFNQTLNHGQLFDVTLKALILMCGPKQQTTIKFERLNDLTDGIVTLFNKNKREVVLSSLKTMFCLLSRYPN